MKQGVLTCLLPFLEDARATAAVQPSQIEALKFHGAIYNLVAGYTIRR